MLKEYMLSLGYTEEDVEAFKTNYSLESTTEETLIKKIKIIYSFFITYGYTCDEINKMTTKYPSIYSYSLENIKNKINSLEELGFSEEQLKRIIKKNPQLLGLSLENINNKINNIVSLGFDKKNIFKMISQYPAILNYTKETFEKKLNNVHLNSIVIFK